MHLVQSLFSIVVHLSLLFLPHFLPRSPEIIDSVYYQSYACLFDFFVTCNVILHGRRNSSLTFGALIWVDGALCWQFQILWCPAINVFLRKTLSEVAFSSLLLPRQLALWVHVLSCNSDLFHLWSLLIVNLLYLKLTICNKHKTGKHNSNFCRSLHHDIWVFHKGWKSLSAQYSNALEK